MEQIATVTGYANMVGCLKPIIMDVTCDVLHAVNMARSVAREHGRLYPDTPYGVTVASVHTAFKVLNFDRDGDLLAN